MRQWIREHRGTALTIGGLGVIAIAVVLVWFEPQGLLFDERVDDTLPGLETSATTTTAVPATTTPPPTSTTTIPPDLEDTTTTMPPTTTSTTTTTTLGPIVLSETDLIDVGRDGTGKVLVVQLPDGERIVRFEELDVVNGPDLVVILSPSPLVSDRDAYDDGDFVDIGDLKGNQGNQNYTIPADVDLSQFQTVAIWCRRFNYTFNAAPIEISDT